MWNQSYRDVYKLPEPALAESLAETILAEPGRTLTVTVPPYHHPVFLTQLDQLISVDLGLTKRELLAYYARIAPALLPHLIHRPLRLRRTPHGLTGEVFFQMRLDETADYLPSAESGVVCCNNLATLLHLVNLGCYVICPSPIRPGHTTPDWLHWSLRTALEGWQSILVPAAQALNQAIAQTGGQSYWATSTPGALECYMAVKAGQPAADLATLRYQIPQSALPQATMTWDETEDPTGDSLQICCWDLQECSPAPYSLRADVAASLTTPVTMAELTQTSTPPAWTLQTLSERVTALGDLFQGLIQH
jgi:bifunctional non-homologous end joining protein LigD